MNIRQQCRICKFIHNFGNSFSRYQNIKDDASRVNYLMDNFGRNGIEVLTVQQHTQNMPLPFGWLSRIINFLICLVDWRA